MAIRNIHGILAPPRVSRNDNIYLPEELARADGLTVPLYDLHEDFEIGPDGRPTGKILPKQARGSARLIWNKVLQRLEFVGKVWDTGLQRLIEIGKRPHVSLAAEPRYNIPFRGHNVPIDLQFFSMATVDNPGIPETTITMEHFALGEIENRALMETPTFPIMRALGPLIMLEGVMDEAVGTGTAGAATGSTLQQMLSEPLHPDFQKIKSAMSKQYGDKADNVFYAYVNKHGFNDTKPFPKEDYSCPHGQMLDECAQCQGTAIPTQTTYPGNVAPGRGDPWAANNLRSGLTGVSATSNLTPMQGDGTNNPGVFTPDPRNDPLFHPDGAVDNPNASNVGVSEANNGEGSSASPDMPGKTAKEDGDASSALDDTIKWPNGKPGSHGSPVKNIGMVDPGRTDASYEKYQPQPGSTATNPNQARTQGVIKPERESGEAPKLGDGGHGTTGTADMPGDDDDKISSGGSFNNTEAAMASPLKGEEEEEAKEDYGFTKEEIQRRLSPLGLEWSNLSKTEQEKVKTSIRVEKLVKQGVREGLKAFRMEHSGVQSTAPIASSRESRVGGIDVTPANQSLMGKYGIEYTFVDGAGKPNLEDHVRVIVGESGWTTATSYVPYLDVPAIRARDVRPRMEFQAALESYNDRFRYHSKSRANGVVLENIATTTTGAAISSTRMNPALVVPSNLAALLRDTFLFQELEVGTNQALFQTTTAWSMAALTQNTAPSDMSVTLTAPTVTTAERGGVLPISFKAERQLIGGILEGEILAARLGELYDEDYLAVGAGQAFESASIPTTGGLYSTGNQIFGTGVASEGLVTSSMPMTGATLADAQATIKLQGYSPDNLVAVMSPVQFRSLLKDTTYLNRLISFGPGTDPSQSYLAQGVIPEIDGIEIRQSTLPVSRASGSGSPATTTYHAWVYKKGLTAGMAASRDLMIETFRDIQKRNTVISAHYDMGIGVLHPNSLVELVTSS